MSDSSSISMRTETFFDFIELKVPDCWSCSQAPGELLGCWQDDEDNGTLWVDYNLYSIPELAHDPDAFKAHTKETVNVLKGKFEKEYGSCTVTGNEESCILSYSRNYDDEDGIAVTSHSCHHIISRLGFSLLAHLTLVFPLSSMSDAEYMKIRDVMIKEITNPKIDVQSALKQKLDV